MTSLSSTTITHLIRNKVKYLPLIEGCVQYYDERHSWSEAVWKVGRL